MIWLDGVHRVVLRRTTVERHALQPGRPIDEDELQALLATDARRDTLDAAVRLVTRRPHAERELRRKLARRRGAPADIDDAITALARAGAIDDAGFAQAFAASRDRSSPRGRRLIAAELRARGVAAETALAAVAGVSDADAAYRFACRRARALPLSDFRGFRDRLGPQLQRRGFSFAVAAATVERCWAERTCANRPSDTEAMQ